MIDHSRVEYLLVLWEEVERLDRYEVGRNIEYSRNVRQLYYWMQKGGV